MGFDEEWGLLRAGATHQQDTSMRLNGADDGPLPGPGGQTDLASTPAEKKAAADTMETEPEPDTRKATDRADESSAAAVKEFGGRDTGAGPKKVTEPWDKQVKVLMGRRSAEKNAPRGASAPFGGNEPEIHSRFAPVLRPRSARRPPVSTDGRGVPPTADRRERGALTRTSRYGAHCAAVLVAALLTGCQADGGSGAGVPVSVKGLAEMAEEVGPDGTDTCPLPYDFAQAVSDAGITGEVAAGPVPGGSEGPAVTAENGYEADEDTPFAGNPGGLVSCWFHVGRQSVEVHLIAAEKPQPEYLLTPVMREVSDEDVPALNAYLRATGKGEPGRPVLGRTGDYANVRVEPDGEGHAALLLTLGDTDTDRLDERQLTALSRALYGQIS